MNKYKKCEFSITLQKNSDYTITISNVKQKDNFKIAQYEEPTSFLRFKSLKNLEYTYLEYVEYNEDTNVIKFNISLEKNKTYYFMIDSNNIFTNLRYTVSVSQDNWVYAPNGGYWNIDRYSSLSIISSSIGGNLSLSQIYISNNIEEAEKIIHNLGYDDEKYTITSDDVISVILTDIEVISGVYSLGGVIEKGLVVIYETKFAISAAISTSSSVDGLIFTPNLNLIEKFNNYIEKLSLNNSVSNNYYNIYCTTQRGKD